MKKNNRNIFKKYCDKFVKHKEAINALATTVLIFVSIGLILVTIYSAIVASNLGKIEIYLATQKEKQETKEQIILAEDLLLETLYNKATTLNLITFLKEHKNKTEVTVDLLKTTRIQQAKEMIGFGLPKIRLKLDSYLDVVSALKDDLEEIRKATRNRDDKTRRERFDSALSNSNLLINGTYRMFNMDEFIKDLNDYIEERSAYYQQIDKKTEELLQEFSENE